MLRQVFMIATLLCVSTLPAWAIDVAIANAGFEQVVLPCAAGQSCSAVGIVPAWTNDGGTTFKPSTGPGGVFPNGVPEGVNVGALEIGSLVQTLAATLQPNTTYTLAFSVGARADYPFGGYSVELLAGSTVLASDSSLSPRSGTFLTGQIVYSSATASPVLLGQRLGIRLLGRTARAETCFDKISLDAAPSSTTSSASQIASGGGWKTSLTLFNLSPVQNPVRVSFRGDDARPLTLPLIVTLRGTPQAATASSVERTVEPGATLLIESEAPASSATLAGWAEVISSGPVAGFAIFRQRGPDGRDAEGTAPLESGSAAGLLLPFDNTAGFSTGVALVNGTNDAVIVTATIRDDDGAQIGLQAVALPAMGHTAFALPDRFTMTSGRRGIIEFRNTAGGTVTGLGLRFSPFGSFTSIPVTAR